LAATYFDSHFCDSEKLSTGFSVCELSGIHIHYVWIDVCTSAVTEWDRKSYFLRIEMGGDGDKPLHE